jgi:hypothetical protein
MTPLPAPLGGSELVAWRLDQAQFCDAWMTAQVRRGWRAMEL